MKQVSTGPYQLIIDLLALGMQVGTEGQLQLLNEMLTIVSKQHICFQLLLS
jgi:hypothetical protein